MFKNVKLESFSLILLVTQLISSNVYATKLFDFNPYLEREVQNGTSKIDQYCNSYSDKGCFNNFTISLTDRHIGNNFSYYIDDLDKYTLYFYNHCIDSGSNKSILRKHQKYRSHILRWGEAVFGWAISEYFIKHRSWPKDNAHRFSEQDFKRWLKETPRDWQFICKRLGE